MSTPQSKASIVPGDDIREHLKKILDLAVRAPSGDNVQPFTFSWQGEQLQISFDPVRAHHVLDSDYLASRVALGCLIEAVSIASSAFGLKIKTQCSPLREGQIHLCASIDFVKSAALADSLFSALSIRATDRRPYKKVVVPTEDLQASIQRPGMVAHIGTADAVSSELQEFIVKSECLLISHPYAFLQTAQWIRFGKRETERLKDGMPYQTLAARTMDLPGIWLIRKFGWLLPFMRKAGLNFEYRRSTQSKLLTSGLVCISAPNKGAGNSDVDQLDAVETGRAAMRVWLRLNQMGFGVQPLTISSMVAHLATYRPNTLDMPKSFIDHLKGGEALLRKTFQIPNNFSPIWMFRTGESSNDFAGMTPRRKDFNL